MKKLEFEIAGIPALLVGEPSERLYLYVHGKMGCKEEALDFAERACPAGYQVLAIDLPEHGQRKLPVGYQVGRTFVPRARVSTTGSESVTEEMTVRSCSSPLI